MKRLTISRQDLEAIQEHARSTYPDECCGILVGRTAGKDHAEIVRAVAVRNERDDSRRNRYLIAPETVLAAQKQARSQGLEIVGYYHSHPDHPAVPSEFDREHAWPGVSYLIVGVERGRIAASRCWRLRDDRQGFEEEALRSPERESAVEEAHP